MMIQLDLLRIFRKSKKKAMMKEQKEKEREREVKDCKKKRIISKKFRNRTK